jgi:hypothetical protein
MSILACLIGILTLMISVAMQVQEANREEQTGEEHDRAIENAALKQKKEILARKAGELELRIRKERKTVAEMAELKDREVALKMKLEELEKARDPKKTDAMLQKIAENLKHEIAALKKEHPPLDKRLKELLAQLKERREAPKPEESVIVRPGGSGSRKARNIFFVECNSTGIVLLRGDAPPKAISKATIGSNGNYNAFLDEVKKTRDSMVLFLIRKAGNDSYRWAAGWAQSKYEVNIGKLPIPNDGKIDLSLFRN